jgi:hypothetical protein
MHQQIWGYKVEEIYLGVREPKRLNTTGLVDSDVLDSTSNILPVFLGRWDIQTYLHRTFLP